MRRLYVCTLLCAVCLLFLAVSAQAETVTLDGIVYETADGYAAFSGLAEGAQSVTVHLTVNGHAASYLARGQQEQNLTVKEIVFGPEITDVGSTDLYFSDLFYLCQGVERIVLPASLARIDASLSYFGENLREFVVSPDNAFFKTVDGVLYTKDGKTLMSFPKAKGEAYEILPGTAGILPEAFGYNVKLERLSIPEGFTALPDGALAGLVALKELSLPASLEQIGSWALPGDGALQTIAVAPENTHYASVDGALFTKDQKTLLNYPAGRGGQYDMPPGVTDISDAAFGRNSQITGLTIPEGVTQLQDGTLMSLSGLVQFRLPASMERIGETALPAAGALKEIIVAGDSEYFQSYEGVLFSRDGKTLIAVPVGRSGAYEIPLATLILAPRAFGDNQGLTSVTVPNGVTELPQYLFFSLDGLKELYLPASLDVIGEGALPSYGILESVHVAAGNARFKSIDGVLFEGEELAFYPPCHGLSYDVPAGTKSIRDRAFANCQMIQTVSIPRGVTRIGEGTFSECTSLVRVSLPITLTQIGPWAFADCISLSGIILPPGVQTLGENAFSNCPSLASMEIPAGVKEIKGSVFSAHSPEFALYGPKGSAAYWYAWEYGALWAEPGAAASQITPSERDTQSAVVSLTSSQSSLDLSQKPGKGGKSLGKYKNGTTVQVLDTQGDWAHVKLGDTQGYMPLDSLTLTDQFNALVKITWGRKSRNMTEPLKLYGWPGEQAPSQTVTGDETMHVLDTLGVWYHVYVKGQEGYVPTLSLDVACSRERDYDTNLFYHVVANPDIHDRLNLREEPTAKSRSLGRYFNGTQVETIEVLPDGWAHVRLDGKEGYMMVKYLSLIYFGGEGGLLPEG